MQLRKGDTVRVLNFLTIDCDTEELQYDDIYSNWQAVLIGKVGKVVTFADEGKCAGVQFPDGGYPTYFNITDLEPLRVVYLPY